ncbi:MAG: hypothetical protein AAF430_18405 [Myxococcota bacterium]
MVFRSAILLGSLALACGSPDHSSDDVLYSKSVSEAEPGSVPPETCERRGVVSVDARELGYLDISTGTALEVFYRSYSDQAEALGANFLIAQGDKPSSAAALAGEAYVADAFWCPE